MENHSTQSPAETEEVRPSLDSRVATVVTELVERSRLSQRELVERSGLSKDQLSRSLRGARQIELDEALAILSAAGLSGRGALTLTRPLYGRFSGGFGLWGGVQPGLYRVDAGPRLTMRVRDNVRVHVDWRQRVAGNASPPSGPALTLAGDF